jgi:hypothetical protein
MKKIVLGIGVILIVAIGAILFEKWHSVGKSVPIPLAMDSHMKHLTKPVVKSPPLLSVGEWQKYHAARQGALTANPELRDEYQDLLKQMDALQVKSDDAMVAADPKLKPVIAKLDALRMRNGGAGAATVPGAKLAPKISGAAPTVTAAEWQELRAARSKAMQANPDLVAEAKKLQDKMRAYQGTLDADIVKSNPQVKPLITKFESGRSTVASNTSVNK